MITESEIENLAKLSRIKLSSEEKKSLSKDIDAILVYVDRLKKAPIVMDALGRVGAVKNVTRSDDVVSTSAEDREGLLKEAPHRVGDFIAVKKIL